MTTVGTEAVDVMVGRGVAVMTSPAPPSGEGEGRGVKVGLNSAVGLACGTGDASTVESSVAGTGDEVAGSSVKVGG
jgi:hypothetical protein